MTGDHAAVSAGVCVCAASLFSGDRLQRSYRDDRAVLVCLAAHPGATRRRVARATGVPERLVTRNLERFSDDGLLLLVVGGAPGPALLPPCFLTAVSPRHCRAHPMRRAA
ncbi:winged helix-turn-helix transcriptional regulator [Actinacidiphila sp. bgisy144]|uniref:winged helix-turn-helix transcriptional regulator n=1 Tax=Actinacidiphila sp. bgisy144 TaxID=3413791 RepID=UPI003EC09CE2